MKNSSIKNAVKAFLAIALFSLGFAKAAAHIDPSHQVRAIGSADSLQPGPATSGH